MPDPNVNPANPNPGDVKGKETPAAAEEKSLLDGGEPKAAVTPDGSILDAAGQEAKAAEDAENKKILETPDDQLDEAGKAKKQELVKAKETAEKAAAEKAKADAVPEKYEFKMPEGVTLNEAFATKVTPILKEGKVSQAIAQKLVDAYIEQNKADEDAKAADFKKFNEEQKQETVRSLGATYKEEMAYAAKVRNYFFSADTMTVLNASGISNNKNFILDTIKIGKLFSEAKLVDGKPTVTGGKSAADILYPTHGK